MVQLPVYMSVTINFFLKRVLALCIFLLICKIVFRCGLHSRLCNHPNYKLLRWLDWLPGVNAEQVQDKPSVTSRNY